MTNFEKYKEGGSCSEIPNNSDSVSRQAAIDALTHKWDGMVTSVFDVLKELPSAEPETDLQPTCNEVATDCKDEVSRQAVKHLDLFTKAYCRDKSVTNDLAFRCKQCDFEMPNGKCLVKTMARKLCSDYKNFGCMGDL